MNKLSPWKVIFIVQPPYSLEFPGPLTPHPLPPPTPMEIPNPSVVRVWIFSGTTQYYPILFCDKYVKGK